MHTNAALRIAAPDPCVNTTPIPTAAADLPMLIDARDLARMLSVSLATVRRMDSAGWLPRPLRLSRGMVRWVRAEIEQWLQECRRAGRRIDRKEWEAMP